jgi:hypothetical protein
LKLTIYFQMGIMSFSLELKWHIIKLTSHIKMGVMSCCSGNSMKLTIHLHHMQIIF